MNSKVDFFFSKTSKWKELYSELRKQVLACGLTEELKWGCPCYTYSTGSGNSVLHKNIVLIHGFKEYCALLFMKGALLKDPKRILVQQTPNVQSARQIRFTTLQEILKLDKMLKSYILEAIAIEKSGLKVTIKKPIEYKIPEEFQKALKNRPALKTAFAALTPGRQRGYLLYFSAPKQSKTRESRIEKYVEHILKGKGLED